MMYEIVAKTYERAYTEKVYGAIETCNRVAKILECDNIAGVEIVDLQTGAIMLEVFDGQVEWLDTDWIFAMMGEAR